MQEQVNFSPPDETSWDPAWRRSIAVWLDVQIAGRLLVVLSVAPGALLGTGGRQGVLVSSNVCGLVPRCGRHKLYYSSSDWGCY
jgi:hypothetical protein